MESTMVCIHVTYSSRLARGPCLVCFILPRITAVVPASLVAVLLLTGVNIGLRDGAGWDAPTIGDYYDSDVSIWLE